MTDISDIEGMVKDARAFINEDRDMAAGVRSFDGMAELLVEVIRELRGIRQLLEAGEGGR